VEIIRQINDLLDAYKNEKAVYKRKRHDLDQMMTNISHDLRTPLTSAIGYVDLIKSGTLSEEETERELKIISEKLDKLDRLTNSFFEFSKIISRDEAPELKEFNLVGVLEESAVGFFDDYISKGRNIDLKCDEKKLMIESNRIMLSRIFDNIISNALKHGQGDLFIELTASEKKIVFRNRISDLEEKVDAAHVFDEFYTTDISRTRGSTGLGLAISKQFTEMLGGSISADAGDNMFTITLLF
jgi:signal transduction histidine kinase